jgi:hypothetical protein
MARLSAAALLQQPVRLHGIQLGRPTDLLLDLQSWHVLGFVVRCRDESVRFLPYAAAQPGAEEIAVGSALMLLEDVGFYAARGASLRALLGGEVEHDGRAAGVLRDLVVAGGAVVELELESARGRRRVPAVGSIVAPTRASAA